MEKVCNINSVPSPNTILAMLQWEKGSSNYGSGYQMPLNAQLMRILILRNIAFTVIVTASSAE